MFIVFFFFVLRFWFFRFVALERMSLSAFPPTCLTDQFDVIWSLRSLCLQALAVPGAHLNKLPLAVLEEVDRLTELRRKSSSIWPDVDDAWWHVKYALLRQNASTVKLAWPGLREISRLFARADVFDSLQELQIWGSSVLPLSEIVCCCPRLRKLDLRSVSADVMYSPIANLGATLTSLRINSCDRFVCLFVCFLFVFLLSLYSVFSTVADGAHDWLQQLQVLEELNLSRTSVSARMLPSLRRCRSLDLTFTFVNDVEAIVDQLQSVEYLAFGNDEDDSGVCQLEVFPKLPTQLMPQLQRLDLFVAVTTGEDETREQKEQFFRALTEWSVRKKLIQLTVFVNDATAEIDLKEGACMSLFAFTFTNQKKKQKKQTKKEFRFSFIVICTT
jgi:hypothetical protein